jgi:hypothetical protein
VTTQLPFRLRTEVQGSSAFLKHLTDCSCLSFRRTMTEESAFCSCAQQRGKAKEGNFIERLRKMQVEEERLRNPLAQGLPYTTEEPEVSHFSSGYAFSNCTLLGVSELLKKTMFPYRLPYIPAKPQMHHVCSTPLLFCRSPRNLQQGNPRNRSIVCCTVKRVWSDASSSTPK